MREGTQKWKVGIYPYLLIAPSVVTLLLLGAYPFFYSIALSFRGLNYSATGTAGHFIGFKNYIDILGDYAFWNSMLLTAVIAVIALPLEFLIGFGVANLFNREFKGRKVAISLFLVPSVLAPVLVALIWKFLLAGTWGLVTYGFFNKVGLFTDSSVFGSPGSALIAIVAIDIWEWAPFIALVFLAGLQSLPVRPFEAAVVDGASPWQVLRHHTLPMLSPLFVIMGFIRIIDLFKIFDVIFITTGGGPGTSTETISIFLLRKTFALWQLGQATALAVIVFIIFYVLCIIFFKIAQRRYKVF